METLPRYYLDTYDKLFTQDEDGHEFPSFEAMLAEIALILPPMLADEPITLGQSHLSIQARDEDGVVVALGTIIMQVAPLSQDEKDGGERRRQTQQRLGELARRAASLRGTR